jgi:predicted RNase H-like HicB family nuclease
MDGPRYEYDIKVRPAAEIASGRYGFVAAVVDLCRVHPDGTTDRLETPFGHYHGEDAAEAEARAREAVERWVAAQHGR